VNDDTAVPSTAGAGGAPLEPDASGGAAPTPRACIYQLDVESAGGAGGSAGAAGSAGAVEHGGEGGQGGAAPSPTIAKATNRLIGDYLTDGSGRALYVFGADLAGDCQALPVSGCEGDCLLSWPIFHVDARVLAAGVEPAVFGSFTRADGQAQTTYYGWPLYYYANDSKPGDVTGHGSGVWGLAELILPNVVVRRVGSDRLLADGAGRTLYAFAEDTRGTATNRPQSACTGVCLAQHPPFSPSYVGAISTLEPRDFTSFVRTDGAAQVAYKGAPLYYSLLDGRPGAVNGAEEEGFTIVLK
jgi:predicted lipoprotein with Yx(FWY)xxD motif